MKPYLFLFILSFSFISCAQKKEAILGETEFQKEINAEYKDASKSPLKWKDLKNFKSLAFFKFDSTYVVEANFKKLTNEKPFKLKTTTDRAPIYIKYGELTFNLKGQDCKLIVYQSQELMKEEGYEDYLFLPFLDDTNGGESYSGGRYIDLKIPKGDTILLDFNTAYNPYCAYNSKYSCPIVPKENYLALNIEAGVKVFKKH